jgi:hypothetical protein
LGQGDEVRILFAGTARQPSVFNYNEMRELKRGEAGMDGIYMPNISSPYEIPILKSWTR